MLRPLTHTRPSARCASFTDRVSRRLTPLHPVVDNDGSLLHPTPELTSTGPKKLRRGAGCNVPYSVAIRPQREPSVILGCHFRMAHFGIVSETPGFAGLLAVTSSLVAGRSRSTSMKATATTKATVATLALAIGWCPQKQDNLAIGRQGPG